MPAFADAYRIVLLDHRGSGAADSSALGLCHYLNLHPYADDLADVLAHLDVSGAVLVGHSM
ncbi:alpha/beta fold hydrolase [Methylomonas koyamae]|uniref:alpha/beta fold hydrolase n=1 Tax=Methylomonas koyamae TaxID=702114 RepID=UPI001E306C65|nr:alpha/beta fold hydrolase [Methylomonas koyamae]